MLLGTDPETLYQFFWGLFNQYYMNSYTKYIILFIIITTIIVIKFLFKIKLVYKNLLKIIKYLLLSLTSIYLLIVLFYWLRYKLLGIR
jgi:hypothetical protein